MNENNFEYLRDQLKYTGFGEALEIELREKLKQQQPSFILYHETYYEDRVARATLNFSKVKDGDMYFFNSYKVELQKENISDALEHTFHIYKGSNITMKEAYNLMMGRAVNKDFVNKEGQSYNTWVQMDFKNSDENGNFKLQQYHQNYGFDLVGTLAQYPIKELENQNYKEDLIRSLKKGNLQAVTFLKDGQQVKGYIEACPQFKTIGIFDDAMKKKDNRHYKDLKQLDVSYEVVGENKKKSLQADESAKEPIHETKQGRGRGKSIH